MAYCLNLGCISPQSQDDSSCPTCGADLLLRDRYLPIALLGQGGFGRTFKAIDTDHPNSKFCVIKQFSFASSSITAQKTAIDLFYQEAEHLLGLGDHPQIPTLLDFFDINGQPYLIQQYIDGQDLEKALKLGVFSEAEVFDLLGSLLPVLNFLHTQPVPVIHRDIKPANIIRQNSDGALFLVDFGAIKIASQTMLMKTGTSIGSAEYAAPEQVRGKPTFASDIYGLGVTCINLLTGASPFDLLTGDGDWVWRNFLGDNKVSENFGTILDRMIEYKLSKRYSAVCAVIVDFKVFEKFILDVPNDVPNLEISELARQSLEQNFEMPSVPSLTVKLGKVVKYSLFIGLSCVSATIVAPYLLAIIKSAKFVPTDFFDFAPLPTRILLATLIVYNIYMMYQEFSEQDTRNLGSRLFHTSMLIAFSYFAPSIFGAFKYLLSGA